MFDYNKEAILIQEKFKEADTRQKKAAVCHELANYYQSVQKYGLEKLYLRCVEYYGMDSDELRYRLIEASKNLKAKYKNQTN